MKYRIHFDIHIVAAVCRDRICSYRHTTAAFKPLYVVYIHFFLHIWCRKMDKRIVEHNNWLAEICRLCLFE